MTTSASVAVIDRPRRQACGGGARMGLSPGELRTDACERCGAKARALRAGLCPRCADADARLEAHVAAVAADLLADSVARALQYLHPDDVLAIAVREASGATSAVEPLEVLFARARRGWTEPG